jgi:hypothetical protein
MSSMRVSGLRPYSGIHLDCTSTIIRRPFRKVWSAPCRLHLNSSTSPGFSGLRIVKLLRYRPCKIKGRSMCAPKG